MCKVILFPKYLWKPRESNSARQNPCKGFPWPTTAPNPENLMKTVEKHCLHCNNIFNALLKEHKRGNAKFCSPRCSSDHIKGKKKYREPNVVCAFCEKPFYLNASKQLNSKSGLFFCCRKHKDEAQRIGGIEEIMPNHYGKITGESQYRKLAFHHYKKECASCGYDKHESVLQVHHKDCDHSNNAISNLEILCPTCHVTKHRGLEP